MKRVAFLILFSLIIHVNFAQRPELPVIEGPFKPTWQSLEQYQTPEWFRDAKFGIWAHWGPQCEPEDGDWYARNMYIEGSEQYKFHLKKYGHPSFFGFKDVIHLWKADSLNAEKLVSLYKKSGAKYFVGLAVHHDNFDLWDSKYQPWNSVNMGPKKDIVGLWAQAAKKAGLPFGVSIHARSAWTWYEVAQLSDTVGTMAGVPYDGKLTKADGKGKWWEGYDPQDLYEQNHKPSIYARNRKIQSKFPGDSMSFAFKQKFYNRVMDVIDKYKPDLVYFDDYKLPIGIKGINEYYGLSLVSNIYNGNIARNNGVNKAVVNAKSLTGNELKCVMNDLEVGTERQIQPIPWQSDACIGGWHYKPNVQYKSAEKVIRALVDVVSKNGNLLLSIPIRGNGTIDDRELAILNGIGEWLKINGEAIYGTRPWIIYGEGPSTKDSVADNSKGNLPLYQKKPYTAEDIRFTTKGGKLYAIVLAWPDNGKVQIKSLSSELTKNSGKITKVSMLGCSQKLHFIQNQNGLLVNLPSEKPNKICLSLCIEGLNINSDGTPVQK